MPAKKPAAKKPAKKTPSKQTFTEYTMSNDGMDVTGRWRQLAKINEKGERLYFTGKPKPKRFR